MSRHRILPLGVLIAVSLLAGGCSSVGLGGGGDEASTHLTVRFRRAVALYEQSSVRIMGMPAGTITEVEPEGDNVRVEIEVDGDVPVPADVEAAVVPLSLIGERSVVLFPAWREGEPEAQDGDVIPIERTHIPAEPDEALAAFTELARGLDPEELERLISESAETFDGQGDQFNAALEQAGDLSDLIAREDDSLVAIAEDLNRLSSTLNTRSEQLGNVLDSFATATEVLAEERNEIEALMAGLGDLAETGDQLVAAHEAHLPEDLAQLSRLARAAETNAEAVGLFVEALSANNDGLIGAYRPELGVLAQRINLTPITMEVLRPLFTALGLQIQDCVPQPGVQCQ
jgi:virulence factor Mce-like protein